jgi:hypothetical protein
VKIFDGAAVEALGLGLEAKEGGGDVGLAVEDIEAVGKPECPILGEGGLDALADLGSLEDVRLLGSAHGLVEAVGEEAGFERVHAEHGVLGEGDALDGETFLGIDGLVGGDSVGDESGDLGSILHADDGEGVGVEAVLAGVLGGSCLAFGSLGPGGMAGVGAVGCDALLGSRHTAQGLACYM